MHNSTYNNFQFLATVSISGISRRQTTRHVALVLGNMDTAAGMSYRPHMQADSYPIRPAWSKAQWPRGAALHSSNEPAEL